MGRIIGSISKNKQTLKTHFKEVFLNLGEYWECNVF